MVYEANCSGSFIDELSGDKRIIITATNNSTRAIIDTGGGLFSNLFFDSISAGKTIKVAFEDVSEYFKENHPEITPLLDDNGDDEGHKAPLPNGGDGHMAKSKYIGTQRNVHSYNNGIPVIRLEGV